ncbi:MAG: PilZ domain-containing protein [Candidatus Zixiibacteriota bacterium]
MSGERRKNERHSSRKYLKVHDHSTRELLGRLVNLSSDGAMLITPGPVKVSGTRRCAVQLVDQIMGRDEIIFDAECRWCRKNVKEDRWESGYRLTVTGIDAVLISYLILGLKLRFWGEEDLPDAKTVEKRNRRKSDRYELDRPLPVFERNSYRQIGELADFSLSGIRIITPKPVDKDTVLHCRVKLPEQVFQREYLVLDVRCMWCRQGESGLGYESGYSIVNISRQDASIILHLLVHKGKKQLDRPRMQVVG